MTDAARLGMSARLAAARKPVRDVAARGLRLPRTILAFPLRDLAEGRLFRASLILDLAFGLINLVSFLFISRVLHHPGVSALNGASTYFDFVAVGLAYLMVVQATCGQLNSRVLEQQRSGTLEATVASPVNPHFIGVGMGIYPTLFGMLRSAVYLLAACLLLGLDVHNADWVGVLVLLVIGAIAALGIGIVLAAYSVAASHGATVGRVAVLALGFLSGAYFPVSVLPAPLSWISTILPTRMAIDGFRAALAGGAWVPTALVLTATTAVALPLSTWLFSGALGVARRKGTLVRG